MTAQEGLQVMWVESHHLCQVIDTPIELFIYVHHGGVAQGRGCYDLRVTEGEGHLLALYGKREYRKYFSKFNMGMERNAGE